MQYCNSIARVTGSKILTIGGLLFGLALIWPPLLLLVAAILSITIPYAYRENDSSESRRRLWTEFLKRDDLPVELKCTEVDLEERYWTNGRGMALLTSTMVPKNNAPIRAVVCFCHGYMDNSSFLKRIQYQRFVKNGIAVVMIEYEGHGRSDGPNALIPSFDTMVGDAHKYFNEIGRTKFQGKKLFLMGESMVCLENILCYFFVHKNYTQVQNLTLIASLHREELLHMISCHVTVQSMKVSYLLHQW